MPNKKGGKGGAPKAATPAKTVPPSKANAPATKKGGAPSKAAPAPRKGAIQSDHSHPGVRPESQTLRKYRARIAPEPEKKGASCMSPLKYGLGFTLGLVITLPILILLSLYWVVELVILSFRTLLGQKQVFTNMAIYPGDVFKITTVSYKEQLDFLFHRSYGYTWNLAWSYALALGRWASGTVKTEIIPDETLAHFTTRSLFAHGMVKTETGFNMDTTYCQKLQVLRGACFEVTNVAMDHDGNATEITMVDGSKHHPDDATWDLAKLHFQGSFNTLTTCFEHSWVHFIFPDAGVVALDQIDKKSLLYKMLWPHLRYTAAINRIRTKGASSIPINNSEGLAAMLETWLHLPYNFETFIQANSEHSNRYYFPEQTDFHRFTQENMVTLSNFELPAYPRDYQAPTAYHQFLSSYFFVVQDFVENFRQDLEKDSVQYQAWVKAVAKYLPAVANADMVDVISTLIWQVSVVHSTDHMSLDQYRPYLCGYQTRRFDKLDVDKTGVFFRTYDLIRTRSFLDNFDLPWHNPFQPLRLQDCDHKFNKKDQRQWDADFRTSLKANEQDLIEKGINIVPLYQIYEVLCF